MFSISVDLDDSWVVPVYDHVHHGRCFDLLERARAEYLRAMGFPNDELLAAGKALVIGKVEASYLREVKKGLVKVTCEEMAIEGRTLFVRQKILNSRGKIAVDARIESIFMDINTRRGMDVPADFKAAFLKGPKG